MQFLYELYDGKVTELDKEITKRKAFLEKVSKKIVEALDPSVHIFEAFNFDLSGNEVQQRFLTKSGARYLCKIFDLYPFFTTSHHVLPNGDVGYGAVCVLKDRENNVLSEGESEQSLFIYRNTNTAIKMARKSALVDAVISLFGLDDQLSQDEDYLRKIDPNMLNPNASSEQSLLSVEAISTLAKQKGVKIQQILERYGVSEMSLLTGVQLNEIKEILDKKDNVAVPGKKDLTQEADTRH